MHYLSQKDIPLSERLIFALDVPSVSEAKDIILQLRDAVSFYKMGLELFMTDGYFELLQWILNKGKKVFVDLKFFDVPETVGRAVRQLQGKGISFMTVHGNDSILKSAVREKRDCAILAVTVLTSLDKGDIEDLGFAVDVQTLVLSRAKRALAIGCDGVVCSGLEALQLRKSFENNFLIVTPGIRPVVNTSTDDQKRTVDIEEAFLNGADYIVIGRPIKNASDPYAAATAIGQRIKRLFESKPL